MEELTRDLARSVQALGDYLHASGQAQPSFDRATPPSVLPSDAPKDAHIAREGIMDCALKIFQLAAGPSEYLANLQTGVCLLICSNLSGFWV